MSQTQQPFRRKHVPTRSCVVCRAKFDKPRLTRFVLTADNQLVQDPTGKANGRGAYLCENPACWQRAHQSNIVDRALRATLSAEAKQVFLRLSS